MTAAEQVLCIADKVRQGELPEISGVIQLGVLLRRGYQTTAPRLRELVAALDEQENVQAGDYNRDHYDGLPHEQVTGVVARRVDEAVQALTGTRVIA